MFCSRSKISIIKNTIVGHVGIRDCKRNKNNFSAMLPNMYCVNIFSSKERCFFLDLCYIQEEHLASWEEHVSF